MITKSNFEKILKYCSVLFLILLSKTVYFGFLHENVTSVILFGVCIIVFLRKKTINTKNFADLLIGSIFLLTVGLLHVNETESVALFLLKREFFLVCGFVITNCIGRNEFKTIFTNIILFVSGTSIICKTIQILNPRFVLSVCKVNDSPKYFYTFFHTFGRNLGLEMRNYGPFWEPGAFQIFLVMALIFMLSGDREDKKSIGLLIFTLVTTGSTLGYISLLILSPWIIEKYFGKKISAKNLLVIFIFICGIAYVLMSRNLTNKFTPGNASLRDRTYDIEYGLQLIKMHPFKGFGSTTIATSNIHNIYYCNSNGILSTLFTFGIPFGIFYLIKSFANYLKLLGLKRTKEMIIAVLVLLVSFLGEEVNALILFWIFMFQFQTDNISIIENDNKNL